MACSNVSSRTAALAAIAALLGAAIVLSGIAVAIAAYNECNRVPYCFLNHFISELGWARISPMAWAFNGAIVLGDLLFAPLLYALGRHVGTRLGYAGMGLGFFTVLAGAAVGILPLDHVKPHLSAAVLFFLGWLGTVSLFTIAFQTGKFPRHLVIAGIVAILLCAVFLALPKSDVLKAIEHPATFRRPPVWWLAVVEWAVFVSMLVWMIITARFLWRTTRPTRMSN